MLILTMLLSACQSSELNIRELQTVPHKVEKVTKPEYTLQLISEGEKYTYIVFHSQETVTAKLELGGNILTIKLDTQPKENTDLKRYVYKITRGDAEYDYIQIKVNGKDSHFDNSTGI